MSEHFSQIEILANHIWFEFSRSSLPFQARFTERYSIEMASGSVSSLRTHFPDPFRISQALGILVLISSIPHRTSTPNLSTLSSSRCLTSFCCEKPHLKAGFTLRCFQRLSLPNAATQLYGWRHNWYTVGSSTPVLSY